jgi:hypothetical protein
VTVLLLDKTMRRKRLYLILSRTAKAVAVVSAIFLVLVLGALAVIPSLHQRLHSDSHHRDHCCVITEFATGQLSGAEVVLVIAVVGGILFYGNFPGETPLISYLGFNFASPRAPPR